jgi:nucleoside 2-deoxyribosyltransferase
MPFKVFLSYGSDPSEQVTAWRLQTLATTHGITVFVPQRSESQSARRSQVPSEQIRRQIDQSDCVLAIIASRDGPAEEAELIYAASRGKTVVPILQEDVVQPAFLKKFRTFRFSPWNAGDVETQVVEFLKGQKQKLSEDRQQAVGALVAIGLGLFLLLALTEK